MIHGTSDRIKIFDDLLFNLTTTLRNLTFLALIFFLAVPVVDGATVDPGKPSTIEVSIPETTPAGTGFTATLTILDGQGNVVDNYSDLDREILLSATGQGELSESVIGSDQFEDGKLTITLKYNNAEDIRILAQERNYVASGESGKITVQPGTPATFRTRHPDTVRAGESFRLSVEVFDRFGNPVKRYSKTSNGVRFETTGLENPSPEFLSANKFQNGKVQTTLSYDVSETMRVVLIDEANEIRSLSDTISVRPGKLDNFTLSVPNTAQAGVPFRTAIEARDRFGNIVQNYSQVGQGVELRVPGGKSPEPSFVPPEQFKNGVAFLQLTHSEAGPIELRAQDRGSSIEGQSNEILIKAGPLDGYEVSVPEQVRADETFKVKVEPTDQFGNRKLDYSSNGNPVVISVRGQDEPRKIIDASDFSNGKAKVSFYHRQAESVRLTATNQKKNSLTGQSPVLVVTPGKPGDILIDNPETVTAGENFTAQLTLADEYGNRIQETGFLSGKIRVSLINGESPKEHVFTPSQFIEGQNQVAFRHETAEDVSVFVEYGKFNIRKRGTQTTIQPASFDQLAVSSPGSVNAGRSFEVSMTMLDRYGNELTSVPERLSSLRLVSSGNGNIEPKYVSRPQVTAPTFTVSARYFIAETMSLKVLDSKGNRLGISAPLRVTPGEFDSFGFQVPDEVSADGQFTLRLEAKDAYENTLINFSERDGSVKLESTGQDELNRDRVKFGEFASGIAEVPLEYRTAGSMKIVARTNGVESTSDNVKVTPGSPDRFEVLTQDRVKAGEPFPAVIRVYDQYDNPVTNLPENFFGVQLASEGSRRISPRKIAASNFEDGEADVLLAYPKTGNLSLSASPLESPMQNPAIDRFYLERDVDTAHVYVLSSKPASFTVDRPSGSSSEKIQVNFKPANMMTSAHSISFDDWFIKSFEQRQAQFGDLPIVTLNIFPREDVSLETEREENLLMIRVESNTSTSIEPTLQEIEESIQNQEYEEAQKQLNNYLDENPGDQDALKLRLRLKRLRDLVGS